MEELKCSLCDSLKIREIEGDMVCINCGLVIYNYIYKEDLIHDSNIDYYNPVLLYEEKKSFTKIDNELKNICINHFNMTNELYNSTKELFKDIKKNKIIKGEHLNGYIAGSIYFTYKLFNISKQSNDIICYFKLSTSKFNICCNEIIDILSDKPYFSKLLKETFPEDLLVQMIYKIEVLIDNEWKVIKGARQIIEKLNTSIEFKNIKPSKINATIIYITCKMLKIKIMKNDISKSLDVSIVTMVKHEKIIQEILKKL